MAILVVGGAGYIGSHMSLLLAQQEIEFVILDDLSSGRREFVEGFELVEGRLDDVELLSTLFSSRNISAVMHFAAFIEVGESVVNPAKYYQNNVHATQSLLDCMVAHEIKNFIFSSTAAIFGTPEYTPIDEKHPKQPINPYGRTKWMVEQILDDYDHAYGLKSVCLRYFNAAGADPGGRTGECHDPETHLIPLVLQAASGRRERISIFGDDYETADGTCIRDYVHVEDLSQAHLLAIKYLEEGGQSGRFNLGNGRGFSVREVIDAAERATGRKIEIVHGDRREGDPPILVADSTQAREVLGWEPKFGDLNVILDHAWSWEQRYFLGKEAWISP
jgi:UDP-glucose 4-epimerase